MGVVAVVEVGGSGVCVCVCVCVCVSMRAVVNVVIACSSVVNIFPNLMKVESDLGKKDEAVNMLVQEVRQARKAIEERERELEEERLVQRRLQFELNALQSPAKKHRRLPTLPGKSLLARRSSDVGEEEEETDVDAAIRMDAPAIEVLQEQVEKLEHALEECREQIRQKTVEDNKETAEKVVFSAPASVIALRDELMVACRTLDGEAVLELAKEFHAHVEGVEAANTEIDRLTAEVEW